eukprot:3483597-Rhodomonas_salina.1
MRSRADPAFCADSLRALLRLALLWLRCPQDVLLQLPRQLRARTPHLLPPDVRLPRRLQVACYVAVSPTKQRPTAKLKDSEQQQQQQARQNQLGVRQGLSGEPCKTDLGQQRLGCGALGDIPAAALADDRMPPPAPSPPRPACSQHTHRTLASALASANWTQPRASATDSPARASERVRSRCACIGRLTWHSRGPLSSPALALPELSGRIATTASSALVSALDTSQPTHATGWGVQPVAVHRRAGDGRGHVLVDDLPQHHPDDFRPGKARIRTITAMMSDHAKHASRGLARAGTGGQRAYHAQRILVQLHRVDVRALLAAVPEPGVDKVVDWHVLAVVEHAAENRAVRRAREQRRRRWQHPARELHLFHTRP